ncbi:hypothetical protein [Allobranchiibius sp. GilTou73]|uniref:hypothetical protein n=1 Tax=Allobranchiibius sp. GilTou73 TaxID=2904523 RepID=UPI001F40F9BE|nr:hypothetical protein [Allobranchiibius sp. GilTou73]UIJ35617.1 hypothetical protein LVQ62_04325 [Allobranchiibius sp. GilTou73]
MSNFVKRGPRHVQGRDVRGTRVRGIQGITTCSGTNVKKADLRRKPFNPPANGTAARTGDI